MQVRGNSPALARAREIALTLAFFGIEAKAVPSVEGGVGFLLPRRALIECDNDGDVTGLAGSQVFTVVSLHLGTKEAPSDRL